MVRIRSGKRYDFCLLGLQHLCVCGMLLLTGCIKCEPADPDRFAAESPWLCGDETWILAPDAEQLPAAEHAGSEGTYLPAPGSLYWEFSSDTRLVSLPSIDDAEAPVIGLNEPPSAELLGQLQVPQECDSSCELAPDQVAVVLPEPESAGWDIPELVLPVPKANMPQPADPQTLTAEPQALTSDELEPTPIVLSPEADAFGPIDEFSTRPESLASANPDPTSMVPSPSDHSCVLTAEERHLLELIESETLAAATGRVTDNRLDQLCRERIATAYGLSAKGAVFAARQQIIEVLRRISQAKDNRDGSRTRTESLAAGLRALEEADDFTPRGSHLEAEMNLAIICAAHRTPLARELQLDSMLPGQMVERYNRYAQIKLAVAVAGEPAGSMALYALGKLHAQLAATEPEQHPHCIRRAVAFQQAALLAHNENYLAAHELGVLLAETGHYQEARHLLLQVAVDHPNPTVFSNLARVHEALGDRGDAQLCRVEAEQLASRGNGSPQNIAWVSPHEFSRNQMNTFTPQMASNPPAPAVAWR